MQNVEQQTTSELTETAKANMSLWLETLGTKDPKKVAAIYTEDATFLPTVSGDFKRGKKGAEEYFEHFLAKNPEGEVTEEVIASMGEDAYLHCGMYTFKLDDGDGGRTTVQARFSYVWKKNGDNEWKINHHHSSVRPE